jgi:hypothetical protein
VTSSAVGCRAALRKLLPTAFELIYDNYNFFVMAYCSTAKPSTCIVSLAAAANGVSLSFYQGASLKDPEHLLQGEGEQNRFVRLPTVESLRAPGVAVKALPLQAPSGTHVRQDCAGQRLILGRRSDFSQQFSLISRPGR